MIKISVIGLGKLGLCFAACFSAKGFDVIGVDINRKIVDAVNSGSAPVAEPMLQEFMVASGGRLRATQSYEEALNGSDVTFIVVPTPSAESGHFSDKYLKDAITCLSLALKAADKKYHLFVVTSTVSPGTIEEKLIPLIESVSGKKLNKDFGICCNPEFIALGSVIEDFLNPDLVLIGESSKFAGDFLEEIYKVVCWKKAHIFRASIINAEIAKISLNCYVTMKISFVNTLANICEAVPRADVDVITQALGNDRRISPHYFKGGTAYGGPCFPRDNLAFLAFAKKYGIDARLAKASSDVNQFQIRRLTERVLTYIPESGKSVVAVLGLSYKTNTGVIEESAGVKIIEGLLKKRDVEIIAYDPLAMDNAKAYFGDNVLYASSVKDCFSNASVCIITTQAGEFGTIDDSYIANNPTLIIDCWRMLDPAKLGEKAKYIPLGKYKLWRE